MKKLSILILATFLSTSAFSNQDAQNSHASSNLIDFKIKQVMVSFPSACDPTKNISESLDVPTKTPLSFGGFIVGGSVDSVQLPQTSQQLIKIFKSQLPKIPFEFTQNDLEFYFGAEQHGIGFLDFESHLSCVDKTGITRRIHFHIYDGQGTELSRDTQLKQNPADGIITLVGNFNNN